MNFDINSAFQIHISSGTLMTHSLLANSWI